jgi:hypothetical protein
MNNYTVIQCSHIEEHHPRIHVVGEILVGEDKAIRVCQACWDVIELLMITSFFKKVIVIPSILGTRSEYDPNPNRR